MTKKDIRDSAVIQLYDSNYLTKEAKKMLKNSSNVDDLVAETYLILLQYKPINIIYKVYIRGEINTFARRIMKTQLADKHSSFYLKYMTNKCFELNENKETNTNYDGNED